MLPDGQFKIVDRIKDMISVSGLKVTPNEVEDVIASHPDVVEVAVIGLPDRHSGEAVTAYVVSRSLNLTEDVVAPGPASVSPPKGPAACGLSGQPAQDQCREGAETGLAGRGLGGGGHGIG